MFRLFALGGLRIEGPEGRVVGAAAQPRPLAILVILASSGDRGTSRDRLISLLWPERDDEKARHILSQSLYALRRSLGSEEPIVATTDLRLDSRVITSDIDEFKEAVAVHDDERAFALYTGSFLDGFYLSGSPEFESWVTAERDRLATRYAEAVERIAKAATERGDTRQLVSLWTQRAQLEPLDGRTAFQLVQVLVAAGDATGAIRISREYQQRLRRELDLEPPRDLIALTQRLEQENRRHPDAAIGRKTPGKRLGGYPFAASRPASSSVDESPREPAGSDLTSRTGGTGPAQHPESTTLRDSSRLPEVFPRWYFRSRRGLLAAIGAAAVLVVAIGVWRTALSEERLMPVAVGVIRNQIVNDSALTARAMPDLLTTGLSRISGLPVIPMARLYELTDGALVTRDTGAALATAARLAGARELIEGVLTRTRDGLRLEIERVDIATGRVRQIYDADGADAADVVDRATSILAAAYHRPAPTIPLRSVTSVSMVARRFYEEGLRSFYSGDAVSARILFATALAADSTFAMAAHYLAETEVAVGEDAQNESDLARRLAPHASERERLLILASVANRSDDPIAFAYADTLLNRYPSELDAYLIAARQKFSQGDFPAAISHLRKVIALEALAGKRRSLRCRACDARGILFVVLENADSLGSAESLARVNIREHPALPEAWGAFGGVLEREGRLDQADSAYARESLLRGGSSGAPWRAALDIRRGDFPSAERRLRRLAGEGTGAQRDHFMELLTIVLRNRGRPHEALTVAEKLHREVSGPLGGRALDPFARLPEALSLLTLGDGRAAAAQFDTMASLSPFRSVSRTARHRAWMMAQRARSMMAAGDTSGVQALSDTIRVTGARTAYARDQRLYLYVRGLLSRARGDKGKATAELLGARYSPTETYLAVDLARLELAEGRAREAAEVAAAALRGPLDSQNQYELRTELHEVLADALRGAGESAAAAEQYKIVASAWAGAEPAFARRGERAKALAIRLTTQ